MHNKKYALYNVPIVGILYGTDRYMRVAFGSTI